MAEYLTFPIRSDKLTQTVSVTETVAHVTTAFQTIDIVDTEAFGRMLLLDGHIQLAELDEHAYHEGLVHVPTLSIPSARRALVVGGGDGGVIRELCRVPGMERIDMVEIDAGVIATCREHLPSLSAGAFDDPRVHLTIGDAFPFVKQDLEPYDFIVVDSTDTYEEEDGEISAMLFTEEFYRDIARLLSPQGVVVTQADNLLFCPYSLEEIQTLFARVFPVTGSYYALVPSFGGFSGYCYASHGVRLGSAIEFGGRGLRYLNPVTYALGFAPLPY